MLGPVPLVGYVFHADWAETNTTVIEGFLAASVTAEKYWRRRRTNGSGSDR
jgi:hypothetical protein